MSGGYPSLKPHYGKPWTEWLDQVEKKLPAISLNDKPEKTANLNVSLLPRKDILLYGLCPKMDVRVLCQCERCGKLLMPVSYVAHMKEKHGPDQVHQPPPPATTSQLKKKHPHSKSKKINPPPVPPPPLFQPYEAPVPACPIQGSAAISATTTTVTTTSTSSGAVAATAALPAAIQASESKGQSTQSLLSSKSEPDIQSAAATVAAAAVVPSNGTGNGNTSKHKNSKKSSKKVKEFLPDKHCGVVEGNKGPCLRSITCSNHMIHLRKAVSGRSKDLLQLIAEHKASKEKEIVKTSTTPTPKAEVAPPTTILPTPSAPVQIVTTAPNISPPIVTPVPSSKAPSMPLLSQPLRITVPTSSVSLITSQGSNDNNTPTSVVYMPMSPVAVVSPIQFVQFGGPILRVASTQPILSPPLATQPVVMTIPLLGGSGSQYSGHPKPLILSSCSSRKIGGAVVLQNQRVDRQRSEIQVASNMRRSVSNSCATANAHHKPNILKSSAKAGNMKMNSVKRQSSDKLVNDNNKHIRMSDLNGYILHADVSEAAETPQPNSLHEKVTFINMK